MGSLKDRSIRTAFVRLVNGVPPDAAGNVSLGDQTAPAVDDHVFYDASLMSTVTNGTTADIGFSTTTFTAKGGLYIAVAKAFIQTGGNAAGFLDLYIDSTRVAHSRWHTNGGTYECPWTQVSLRLTPGSHTCQLQLSVDSGGLSATVLSEFCAVTRTSA